MRVLRLCVFVMVVGYYIKPVIRPPQTFVFFIQLEQLIIVNNGIYTQSRTTCCNTSLMSFY
jgi:hypothetical protein